MIKDLSLHGIKGGIEFFALVRGEDAKSIYFYDESPQEIRFFSRGNEFALSDTGFRYNGIGGSFCEYMFGIEIPINDFTNKEVLNRLVMYGAFVNQDGSIKFTNDTSGSETFERYFIQGHAVTTYFFSVASDYKGEPRERQRTVLGTVGKLLKRTPLVSENRDIDLLDAFYKTFGEQDATVFIFKLINKRNEEFYNAFKELYGRNRQLTQDDDRALTEIVHRHRIDYYQQERMKIDIMYKHMDNKRIVDEYRDILLDTSGRDVLMKSELARLRRLKTLRIRNNIPSVLFETLDELLLKGKKIEDTGEPEYLTEARSILENLFFKDAYLKSTIINEDIIRLLKARNAAYAESNMGFEGILLDIGKACDDTARETGDYSIFEQFSAIVTYFDRYDHVQATMSQVAFMENINFSEDTLRSLVGNFKEFEDLEHGLFAALFVTPLLTNKYITRFGRKKVSALSEGIKHISMGDASLKDVIKTLGFISDEEKLSRLVHEALREKLRSFYPHLDSKEGRDEIRVDIEKELQARELAERVPEPIFEKVFLNMRKESFYLNHLFPKIIAEENTELREDFFVNSGLDRFYIENIEREYFEERSLDMAVLHRIREDRQALLSGGGERI